MIVSLDGIGTYDHVQRASLMQKLADTPSLRCLLPLVAALYGTLSRFIWYDDEGNQHTIHQAEGGEQGCPLMPALDPDPESAFQLFGDSVPVECRIVYRVGLVVWQRVGLT